MKRIILILFVVFSYHASAQMPQLKWVNEMPFRITSMISDDEDNIYVAGDISDTLVLGNDTLIPVKKDVILVKYDSAGSLLWYKQIGGVDLDNTVDVRLGDNNDVFLLVIFDYTTIIEGDTIPYGNYGHLPLLVKYSTDGDFLWWKVPAYNDHGCFHPRMLRSDHENNLIMMNDIFYGTNVIFPDSTIADSLGSYHISKYNSNGIFKWVRTFNNEINQLTTDMSNNLLLIKSTDTISVFDFTKLSPEGNLIWKRKINHNVIGYDDYYGKWLPLLDVDRFNNIYLATTFSDTIIIGSETFISKGYRDIILIKYDSTGYPVWGISSGGPYEDDPTSIFIKDDNILMTGKFRKKIYFTNDSIIGTGASHYTARTGGFIIEYDLNMANESIKKVYGNRDCHAAMVTMGKSIYLNGNAIDSIYFDDYLWTTFPVVYNRLFLARYYDEPPPPEPIVDDFEIYPNPSRGIVNFNFNPAYGEVILELYNLQGALVKIYTLNQTHNSLDLDFLANGLYIAKIISGFKVKCAKFVKI